MAELDRDRIVKAALAIAGREGADGLTMRALADELGVTATALYHHVADKKALIALMVDAVVTEQVLPAPTGDWREDLWRMDRSELAEVRRRIDGMIRAIEEGLYEPSMADAGARAAARGTGSGARDGDRAEAPAASGLGPLEPAAVAAILEINRTREFFVAAAQAS